MVCGEPTNLEIGVQLKGVLVVRIHVEGRAAHGSTPWLGDNAVLKAFELYRRILELPFASGSSELYDHPSASTSAQSAAATWSTSCSTYAGWTSTSGDLPNQVAGRGAAAAAVARCRGDAGY